jgi:hypothetical protein
MLWFRPLVNLLLDIKQLWFLVYNSAVLIRHCCTIFRIMMFYVIKFMIKLIIDTLNYVCGLENFVRISSGIMTAKLILFFFFF